jgi:hypothetical protein
MRKILHPLPAVASPAGCIPACLNLNRFLALCLTLLCLCAELNANTVSMIFDGASGATDFGSYVGPYYGRMNGQPLDIFCVDFANEVTPGQQWDANLTAITPGSDLADARYGRVPEAVDLYEQAAWLIMQFATQPQSEYADIQASIWKLFNSDAPEPGSPAWLTRARNNYNSGSYDDFRIITNTGPLLPTGQVQEFLTRVPAETAPESPGSLLIGLGLVSLSCFCGYVRR